jgi:hypothetical protein
MKYNLVDVEIRRVKVYSNQIDSWMMITGGQIRFIARSILDDLIDRKRFLFPFKSSEIESISFRNIKLTIVFEMSFF